MNFHEGNVHAEQRIASRRTHAGDGACIDDNGIYASPCWFDAVHDVAFVVGLERFEVCAVGACKRLGRRFDLRKRSLAINLLLLGAEESEVRSVDEKDGLGARVLRDETLWKLPRAWSSPRRVVRLRASWPE